MKLKLPLIAAFIAIVGLTACGGGSDKSPAIPVASPATLTMTDNPVGTGTVAAVPLNVTVYYTGWLYSETATGHKGTQFDTLTAGPGFTFKLGAGKVIAGFEEGVIGMKVGGKRTVMIPSVKGYGSAGTNGIPPNSGLVFDIELRAAVP